ncbi:hypothetical protein LTR85_008355 [Meristemomyces frigidus]|nr:hypothetical protein LTR85_008355 [Meristemomyces frigidus]
MTASYNSSTSSFTSPLHTCGSLKTALNTCPIHQAVPCQQSTHGKPTCTCPTFEAAQNGVGNLSSACRQCLYAEATAHYTATIAKLTAQANIIRAHKQHLLGQRVSLACQPFSSRVRRAKRAFGTQIAVLENRSRDVTGHVALAKVVLQMTIRAVEAQTMDNVMCVKSLMTPEQVREEVEMGGRYSV